MQALDEAECRELVHALSGPASSEEGPSSDNDAMLVEAASGHEAFDANSILEDIAEEDISEASAHDCSVPPAPADVPAAAARSKRAEVHAAPRRKTRAAVRPSSLGRQVLSMYDLLHFLVSLAMLTYYNM